jgi:hypothetical protein
MNDLLHWLGLLVAGVFCVAFLVAGWEQLQSRVALTRPPVQPRAGDGAAGASLPVDVPLDTLAAPAAAESPGTATQSSHGMMARALSRAATQSRGGRDGSPWLDTQPRVAPSAAEPDAGLPPGDAPAASSRSDQGAALR